jgi:hypothetical protein
MIYKIIHNSESLEIKEATAKIEDEINFAKVQGVLLPSLEGMTFKIVEASND